MGLFSTKWHVSARTGAVEICKAFLRSCPYPSYTESFDTLKEAEAFEASVKSSQFFRAITSENIELTTTDVERLSKFFVPEAVFDTVDNDLVFKELQQDQFRPYDGSRTGVFFEVSPEHKSAIEAYYTDTISKDMNNFLLNGVSKYDRETIAKNIVNLIGYIKFSNRNIVPKLLKKLNLTDPILYKGFSVKSEFEAEMMKSYLNKTGPGQIFQFESFMSTSLKCEEAYRFARNEDSMFSPTRFVYEIATNNLGGFMNEPVEEFVLPPNSEFVFVNTRKVFGDIHIQLVAKELV